MEKIKAAVSTINVMAFIEWQNSLYNELPEWVENEKEEYNRQVLRQWESFVNLSPVEKTKGLSDKAKSELEQYEKRKSTRETWERLGILDEGEFEIFRTQLELWVKYEMSETEDQVSLGIMPKLSILEDRAARAINEITWEHVERITKPIPICRGTAEEMRGVLCEIMIFQRIEAMREGKHPQSTNHRLQADKSGLYYALRALKDVGILKCTFLELATLVKNNFEGLENTKIESIEDQIKKAQRPVRNGYAHRVDKIAEDLGR